MVRKLESYFVVTLYIDREFTWESLFAPTSHVWNLGEKELWEINKTQKEKKIIRKKVGLWRTEDNDGI